MASIVPATPSGAPFLVSIRAAYDSIKAARARRAQFNETVRELRSLSNRELSDLGIARSNIRSIAYEHAYK